MKKAYALPKNIFAIFSLFAVISPFHTHGQMHPNPIQHFIQPHLGQDHVNEGHANQGHLNPHYAAHYGMDMHAYLKDEKLWAELEVKLNTLKKEIESSAFVRDVKASLRNGMPMDSFEYLNRLAEMINTSERYEGESRMGGNLKQIQIVISTSNQLGTDSFRINGIFLPNNFLKFEVFLHPSLRSNPILGLMVSAKLFSILGGYITVGQGAAYNHHMQQHSHEMHQSIHDFESYSTLKSILGIVETNMMDSSINSIDYAELQFNAKYGRWNSLYELALLDRATIYVSRDSISKFLLTKDLSPQVLNGYSRDIMQVMHLNSALTPPDKMYLSLWMKLKDQVEQRVQVALANADLESINDSQKFAQLQARLANSDLDWMRAIRDSDYASVAKILLDPAYLGLGQKQSAFNPSVHATLLGYARVIEAMAKDIKSVEMITVFRGLDSEDMANFYGIPGQRSGYGFLPPPMLSHGGAGNSTLRFIQRYLAKPTQMAMVGASENQRERLISRMFLSHAGQPTGSFYLSTSTNPGVARGWAASGIAVIKIPKALAVPNALSGFVSEMENMAFVIFPGKESEKLIHVSTPDDYNCKSVAVDAVDYKGKNYKKYEYSCQPKDDFIRNFIHTHAPDYRGKELIGSEFYSEYFGEMSKSLAGYEQLKQ